MAERRFIPRFDLAASLQMINCDLKGFQAEPKIASTTLQPLNYLRKGFSCLVVDDIIGYVIHRRSLFIDDG